MERKQIVLDCIVAESVGHPVVTEGDSHAGWEIRDWVKHITS
jgi:hypothetical protein